MTEENEPKAKIYKSVREISPAGSLLTEITVCVEGNNLKETEQVFDRKWKEKND